MSNEYIRLNDSKLNIQKAENLMAIIEAKRKDSIEKKEMQSENSLFTELFNAFKEFFSKLGKPTIKKRIFKIESPARSSDYNDTMTEISNDVKVAYTETDALSSVIIKDFNYSEAERQMLRNKVKKLASDSVDYSFYSIGAKEKSLYGIDDFIDTSKIDTTKTSPGTEQCELVTNEGVVTLKRVGNIDRSPLVDNVTGIKESIPDWDKSGEWGGYEGLYFGMKNEARPEGGSWHVEVSVDGKRLYDVGATEEEKMPRRLQMFDNNPDTFWEVEYITNPVVGYRDKYTGKQITVSEFNDLVNNDVNSPAAVTSAGGTIVTNEHGSLLENYIPVTQISGVQFLRCSFIVHLSRAENINWLSLNPNNFGQELYMEVLSIQTSADGKKFDEIEGFDDHEYELVLTDTANSELNPREVKDTLSPDSTKFAGQGVWCFAPRYANSIRFDLRQTRSYIKPYEVVMVRIEQTITTTTTKTSWWGLSKKTSTSTETISREVEIPYLTGLIAGYDMLSLEGSSVINNGNGGDGKNVGMIMGGSVAASVGASIGMLGIATANPVLAIIGGTMMWAGAILNVFGLGSFSSKTSTSTISPARIAAQWLKTKYDKARFAISVRDVNIYSYKFAETSEVVSKSYNSPSPVSKLSLSVDEQIPRIFYNGDRAGTENDWIKYYISVDNGTSWHRISPIHHRATRSEDGVNLLPEIINLNSEIPLSERDNPLSYVDTPEPVYEVRFKAVLSRPTDITDAESYTPVLYKYALQIYPYGGL